MRAGSMRAVTTGSVAVLLCLLLSACLLMPGKFTSELDIHKDRRFHYSYVGEIHMLAFSKLAEQGAKASEKFEPAPCRDANQTKRPCTAREIASQKEQWEKRQASKSARRKRDAESAKMLLGGIDPSDPKAAEELAKRMRRQAGWRKVVYKGDGLFDVDFAISGTLDHDFVFPMIERLPMADSFVQVVLHKDGTVRIDAPGFGPSSNGMPLGAMMQAMAGAGKEHSKEMPNIPVMDGTFTIRTDGEILANNTDEGPQADPAGKRLTWTVNERTQAAPTALIRLAR